MSKEVELLKRKLEREKKARKEAEEILESKSLELFSANENLRKINSNLEELVQERTKDLRRTESRFGRLVETANDIIYRNDIKGYITYANPAAIETLGYTLDELKSKHYSELVDPEYLDDVQAFYKKQFEEKTIGTYKEFPILTKTNETVWLGQNVIFLFDEEGKLDQISTVARNITDSKISQSRLHNLITNLQSGVLLEDENRKIALVNQRFCNHFGIPVSPQDLIGEDCRQSAEQSKGLFKDESGFVERVNEILKHRELVLNEEIPLKDGRTFERDYIPIFIESRYSGHLWNYRDITERKNAVEAIRRSEEKYRGIIENMNLGLIEVDVEEKIQYANQSFCEMSGYDSEEVIGKIASDLFVKGDNAAKMNEKNLLRQDGISDVYELAIRNKRGEMKWWLISGGPLFDNEGKRIGSIGIHYDITEVKKLQEDLEEAKYLAEESAKSKEAFLANMSHEIRTPINGIVGMARQLSKTPLYKSQLYYLNTIKNAANNLLVILNDILDLSKIEAGKLSVEQVPFNFKRSMKQSSTVLVPKAEEKGLQFKTTIDDNIPATLIGDPFRLNQVMLNLIGNAIKFTEKGAVEVTCSLHESRGEEQLLLIQVKDTGIGMSESYLKKIFEKFSQEDRSTARQYGGSGLGMNISKQLVELMHGELLIESAKDEGTCVKLLIPFLAADEDQAVEQEKEEKDYKVLKDKKILIAEDNELNRLVIETTLAHYGIYMKLANNGKEAVALLQEEPFDLILMDVQMPIMDGIEACIYIREELKATLPIIALTANVIQGDKERYYSAGMDDIVPKPFEEEKLLEVLLKWTSGESTKSEEIEPEVKQAEELGFSLNMLYQIGRGDQEFVDRMLAIFFKQSEETINKLKLAVSNGDRVTVSRLAHKIKPSLDNLSINLLAQKARELEAIDETTEGQEIAKEVGMFCNNLEEVVRQIRVKSS